MSQYEVVGTRALTDEEKEQSKWFAEQRRGSVDTLDNAAKLIVGLISGMLTLLFGILALSSEPGKLPFYITFAWVRWVAMLGVVGLLISLGTGLAAIMPRKWEINPNQPRTEAAAFSEMLQTKSNYLTWCIRSFGAGMALIGLVLIVAVMIMPPAPSTSVGTTTPIAPTVTATTKP